MQRFLGNVAADENINRQLYRAVDNNDIVEARRLLETRRVDVDYVGMNHGDGSPLLVHAIRERYPRMARLLIEFKADINKGNTGEVRRKFMAMTPLNMAIAMELNLQKLSEGERAAGEGLVELLLQRAADPNFIDGGGSSPFSALYYWHTNDNEKANNLFELLRRHGGNLQGVPERLREDFLQAFDFDVNNLSLRR